MHAIIYHTILKIMEQHKRTLAKTISWRLTGSGATFFITYIISGNLDIASSIAVTQLTINTILYFMHERIWDKLNWGRNK